jgi:NmrA-like family
LRTPLNHKQKILTVPSVTNFWAAFFLPTIPSKLALNQTINEYCYALELQQGENIALAASHTLPTLDLLIWSSLADTTKWSNGKYTWNYHFGGKAHVYDHIVEKYPELAKKTSLLFMGSYMSNFLNRALAPKRVADGSFVLALPHSPDAPEPYVDPPSDTGKFVEALEKLGGEKKLLGVSDMRTCGEFLRVWNGTVGVRGRFEETSREEFIEEVGMVHEGFANELADSRGFNAEFGWVGGEKDVLMPKDVSLSCRCYPVLADSSFCS